MVNDLELKSHKQDATLQEAENFLVLNEGTLQALGTLEAHVEHVISQKEDLERQLQQQKVEIVSLKAQALEWETKFRAQFRELLRCGSEYEDVIAELKANAAKQEEEYKDRIHDLENKNLDYEADIEALKADVKTKDEKMAQARVHLQLSEFLTKTPSESLAVSDTLFEDLESLKFETSSEEEEAVFPTKKNNVQDSKSTDRGTKGLLAMIKEKDTIIQYMTSDKLRRETMCHEHQTECNNEIFRREKVQEQLKASQVDVRQLDDLAEGLEFLFNSTYVKIPIENLPLETQWEFEKSYKDVQRLHEERRGLAYTRQQRIREEEERENSN
ncbi:hypothetical protein FBEOM_2078 [Fusarium beomiforme]|uniref:Uncharacterized protein n=1 Tax=Fusarium beomiforme TaxID=44412 RepID=A0A9P5AS51_9HYPO|nr:hypothetical protein FBEOM_2078 [Fusarium beomiforme]